MHADTKPNGKMLENELNFWIGMADSALERGERLAAIANMQSGIIGYVNGVGGISKVRDQKVAEYIKTATALIVDVERDRKDFKTIEEMNVFLDNAKDFFRCVCDSANENTFRDKLISSLRAQQAALHNDSSSGQTSEYGLRTAG